MYQKKPIFFLKAVLRFGYVGGFLDNKSKMTATKFPQTKTEELYIDQTKHKDGRNYGITFPLL